MKEELLQSQRFGSEKEAALKELEGELADALQRIASMERAQRAVDEELRSVKMNLCLPLTMTVK
jgi:hypothetical protein